MANQQPVDQLELIKLRILATLGTVSGFVKVYRNRGQLVPKDPDTGTVLLPACVFLDGKEKASEQDAGFQGRSRRGQMPPVTIEFEPAIYIVMLPSLTSNNDGIGEGMSAFRIQIHKALSQDRILLEMLGDNGSITYLGYESDMQEGGDLRGVMRLDYRFAYVFDPSLL